MRVLGIGAHPDDVEIYVMGLLLRLKAMGAEVGWAIACDRAFAPTLAAGAVVAYLVAARFKRHSISEAWQGTHLEPAH